jgi:capsular polysaccharide biosynthesis protein
LADLQDAVTVDVALSDLVRVTVEDERPERARELAQGIVDAYLAFAAGLPVPPQVRVLSPAYVLDEPVAPRPARAAAIGLLVGLQLAIVAALLIVRRRRR